MKLPEIILPNFLEFEPLEQVRTAMRAKRVSAEGVTIKVKDVMPLSSQEIVAIQQGVTITNFNDLVEDPITKTLRYKGTDLRVVVYMQDTDEAPKFHLSDCSTLKQMRLEKRYDKRYVAVHNPKTDRFQLRRAYNKVTKERLKVCKNCLERISYKGYRNSMFDSHKRTIVDSFDMEDFFKQYPLDMLFKKPQYQANEAPYTGYTADWDMISRRYKESRNWQCEGCGRRLHDARHRQYLHTHHINGQRNDNREDNLKALCLACHANEHPHMKTSQYYDFLSLKIPRGW